MLLQLKIKIKKLPIVLKKKKKPKTADNPVMKAKATTLPSFLEEQLVWKIKLCKYKPKDFEPFIFGVHLKF